MVGRTQLMLEALFDWLIKDNKKEHEIAFVFAATKSESRRIKIQFLELLRERWNRTDHIGSLDIIKFPNWNNKEIHFKSQKENSTGLMGIEFTDFIDHGCWTEDSFFSRDWRESVEIINFNRSKYR